jgi:hypothetical protein
MFVACANAQQIEQEESWTTDQIGKQFSVTGLLFLDYKQTMDIKNKPGYYEINPILGRHPKDSAVREYFGAVIIAEPIIADLLPTKYRDFLLNGTLTVEILTVSHNYAIGLSGKF